jgi:cobalamin biosynthesis protein CobT
LLAKLLASENIRVEHNAKAQTASFSTKSRVLTLPVWKVMSGDLYDMLVAHEVGHALYSPKGDEWCNDLEKLAPGAFAKMRQYVNIVEDARIERMMKERYAGLRSNFARAYRDLTATNPKLFALDKNLNDLPLIDRVNIHYKVGFAVEVPFAAEEMSLVKRVAETKTWDEVVALAKELYDLSKQQKQEQQEQDEQGEDQNPASGEQGEADESESGMESDEQQRGETEAEGENDEAGESTEGGEESDSDSDSDSAEESDAEQDGEKSKEGKTKGEEKSKPSKPSKSSKSQKVDEGGEAEESITEKMMDQLSKENLDKSNPYGINGSGQITMPVFDVENGVVPFVEVIDDLKVMAENNGGYQLYQKFLAKNKSSVASLVQEFMRRKAADESQRTRTADTGSIDTSRLWAYRISEEIFGSYEIKREGKNHGIVFLLDWSGSMNVILKETVEQLACLVQFCAAASIPCEIYAFSDNHFHSKDGKKIEMWSKDSGQIAPKEMWLLHLLSASARPAQLKTAIAGLLAWAHRSIAYGGSMGKNAKGENLDGKYYLNGTPLNAALVAMNTMIPAFQKKTGVQIVNLCVLTDGDATDSIWYRRRADGSTTSVYASDSSTNQYGRDLAEVNIVGKRAVEKFTDTASLVRFVRTETGCNAMNFRIDSTRNLTGTIKYALGSVAKGTNEEKVMLKKGGETYIKEKTKFLKENDWVSGEEWYGFTEWFGVSNLKADETDYIGGVTADSTKAALAKALSAEIGKTKSSRPLMARIAQRVSAKSN